MALGGEVIEVSSDESTPPIPISAEGSASSSTASVQDDATSQEGRRYTAAEKGKGRAVPTAPITIDDDEPMTELEDEDGDGIEVTQVVLRDVDVDYDDLDLRDFQSDDDAPVVVPEKKARNEKKTLSAKEDERLETYSKLNLTVHQVRRTTTDFFQLVQYASALPTRQS